MWSRRFFDRCWRHRRIFVHPNERKRRVFNFLLYELFQLIILTDAFILIIYLKSN